jgi:hypothetical protein
MELDGKLSVTLVLHEGYRGGIIEKMAFKLCDALRQLGADAAVSPRPFAESMINHFMIFHHVEPMDGTINTMAVTHVDDVMKVEMVRRNLEKGVRAAICMSSMSVDQLAGYEIERKQLTYALPAHDGAIASRRIVIGITSANYDDGRKRDWLLERLSQDISLDDFEFQIFGSGWNKICARLEAAGARVVLKEPSDDYRGDYDAIKLAVPNFDYYFYPGLDEGSLGTLDALSAGVKTIVTRQGFHLDIPNGITHGFWDYDELKQIFEEIVRERRERSQFAQSLTWSRYAHRHLDIWSSLIERDSLPGLDDLGARTEAPQKRHYPLKGYFAILCNRTRRQMSLPFWMPETYKTLLTARRSIGQNLPSIRRAFRQLRGMVGSK